MNEDMNWAFSLPKIQDKLLVLESNIHDALSGLSRAQPTPVIPARDIEILPTKSHPKKKGFSTCEGQARMLHDLASIELQAMELGLRTLVEFPEADLGFREALAAVTLSEGEHLKLCLSGLESLGFSWGCWPIHCNLWTATSSQDSLLDRILIVHRYLEGSGLDAGAHILQRLRGLLVAGVSEKSISAARKVIEVLDTINRDEIEHVLFGSQSYRQICIEQKLDPDVDFQLRMNSLRHRLPRRFEQIDRELRTKAGFSEIELDYCESLRREALSD